MRRCKSALRVALNGFHGCDQLVFGLKQGAALGLFDNLGEGAKAAGNHRGAKTEAFDQDDAKGFVTHRRHDQPQRTAVIGGQLIQRFASQKLDTIIAGGQRLQLIRIIPIPQNQQIGIGIFVALFFVARAVFTLLAWVSPVMIVLALIINYRTVLNYVKWLWSLLSGSPLMGVLAVVLTVIGFPVVAAFLFGKALVDRRMKSYMEERGMIDEYVDYEIVEEEDPDPLTLPTLEERERRSRS